LSINDDVSGQVLVRDWKREILPVGKVEETGTESIAGEGEEILAGRGEAAVGAAV